MNLKIPLNSQAISQNHNLRISQTLSYDDLSELYDSILENNVCIWYGIELIL